MHGTILALLAAIFCGHLAPAQGTDTQLTGLITQDRAPIPGVRVTAEGVGFLETVVASEQGTYEFRAIPRGAAWTALKAVAR